MFPFGEDPSFLKRPPFLFDHLLSKPDGDAAAFFPNFPSPFFDEHELPLNQIFPKPPIINPPPSKKESPKLKNKSTAAPPRKRTGKKDRHSKICTAQGIRDRRMRLSLQVARKFFDLQDMLGYDKASKTIEWLFTKSKKAIKELAKSSGSRLSASTSADSSDSSFASGIEENSSNNNNNNNSNSNNNEAVVLKERKMTRETREKARARARSRTEKKKGVELSPNLKNVSPNLGNLGNLEKLGSASASRSSPNLEGAYAPSDAGTIEKLLGSSSSAAAADVSCCLDPNSSSGFMGFLGNWDLLSNDHRLINYAGNNANPNSIYITPDFPLFHQ